MKIGTMLKNKQNGELVKVDIIGTDGNIAVKTMDGKRKSISAATVKRWYEETVSQESTKPMQTKPTLKKEESKTPVSTAKEIKEKKEPTPKKEKGEKINIGEFYLEKIKKDFPALTIKKKVYYTGLYNGSKIVCLLFPRLKKIIFGFNEKVLADNFNGAAFNKKGHFKQLAESCNSVYNQQITVTDDSSYATATEYVKVIAKVK